MNRVILLLVLLILSSCSFHSDQLNIIKDLLQKDRSQYPEKNWTLLWNNKKTNLYAINLGKQLIFADDNINIFYKNKQIYKVTGLFGGDKLAEISSSGTSLIYKLNGKNIAIDHCKPKNMTIDENEYKRYSHTCFDQKSGDSYENQIVINSENLIVSLKFKINPSYPLLELNIK